MEDANITCDVCKNGFKKDDVVFECKNTIILGNDVEVNFFRCPFCGKHYITEIVDWTVKKKKDRYIQQMQKINRKKIKGNKKEIEEAIQKGIEVKDDLMSYEMKLRDKYVNLIPRGFFEK